MKRTVLVVLATVFLFGCSNKADKDALTVTGEIKNAPDQNVSLEQVFFSQRNPEIIGTGQLKNGSFSISATAPEEGLYRIKLDSGSYFLFINDRNDIHLHADLQTVSLTNYDFNSSASTTLQHFFSDVNKQTRILDSLNQRLQIMKNEKVPDSIYAVDSLSFQGKVEGFIDYFKKFVDTTKSPVMAVFALGKACKTIDPLKLEASGDMLAKRFPDTKLVTDVVAQFKGMIAAAKQPVASGPGIGNIAPELNMNDGQGKPFALSSLRGKYVLVDFWASWCGPCRGENPTVVAAFNKFKEKNFTVLGVSLDDDKAAWLNAVMEDKLTWQHISDLKGWKSAAVPLYGIEGIPYNVLIDPTGKIIASELRGQALEKKLAEVLK